MAVSTHSSRGSSKANPKKAAKETRQHNELPKCKAFLKNKDRNCGSEVEVKDWKISQHCPAHTCNAETSGGFCTHPTQHSKPYCRHHVCKQTGCGAYARGRLDSYCPLHRCDLENCPNIKAERDRYCVNHFCKSPGCKYLRSSFSEYCEGHTCVVQNCPNIVLVDHVCPDHIKQMYTNQGRHDERARFNQQQAWAAQHLDNLKARIQQLEKERNDMDKRYIESEKRYRDADKQHSIELQEEEDKNSHLSNRLYALSDELRDAQERAEDTETQLKKDISALLEQNRRTREDLARETADNKRKESEIRRLAEENDEYRRAVPHRRDSRRDRYSDQREPERGRAYRSYDPYDPNGSSGDRRANNQGGYERNRR